MSNYSTPTTGPGHAVIYQITIAGHLDDQWANWFEGLSVRRAGSGETHLTGPVVDQAALHRLLRKVRDLGLPLLAVIRVEPGPAAPPVTNAPTKGCP